MAKWWMKFVAAMATGCQRGRAAPESSPGGDVITIEPSSCYGHCPHYALSFRPDGTVEYEGKYRVGTHGRQTTRISPDEFSRLLERFDAIHFDDLTWERNCPDHYVADLASLETSITRKGKTHSLVHYLGDGCAPRVLGELEQVLLAAPGTVLDAWIHCDGDCPP
jgi:hypothetical protein